MSGLLKLTGMLLFACILTACSERNGPAPVVESRWQAPGKQLPWHKVSRGETLYAVAFRYDQDYRKLAALNHLPRPYTLRVGQILKLQSGYSLPKQVPAGKSWQTVSAPASKTWMPHSVKKSTGKWQWPATGRIVSGFAPALGKKGIDIAGKKGDRIYAASQGVVAYSGAGLAGYGNLIIIKHDGSFLTAYGNNTRNLVKEGQRIKAGQVIAEMGVIDRKFWGVHFEIRKAGNPVNPLAWLPKG